METAINTSKVEGRRQLHFSSLDEIRADIEQLAQSKELRNLGNWSPGQVFKHLATVMKCSMDGSPKVMPGFVIFVFRIFFKRKFLNKPMPAGFQLPKKAAAFIPGPTTLEEGLAEIRQQIDRLKSNPHREPSAVLGRLTNEEWDQLHCRHAELHLSFLVPVE